jgi:cytochrome oxidase Cu insertion factor (SCO1/SenC/PrrC family)
MKNSLMGCILLSAMMLLMSSATHSQSNKVPPFKMIQADGKVFLAGNLPLGKPIVIIYFSPECEDCQQLTKELLNLINELKSASIAMITYQPKDKVKQCIFFMDSVRMRQAGGNRVT